MEDCVVPGNLKEVTDLPEPLLRVQDHLLIDDRQAVLGTQGFAFIVHCGYCSVPLGQTLSVGLQIKPCNSQQIGEISIQMSLMHFSGPVIVTFRLMIECTVALPSLTMNRNLLLGNSSLRYFPDFNVKGSYMIMMMSIISISTCLMFDLIAQPGGGLPMPGHHLEDKGGDGGGQDVVSEPGLLQPHALFLGLFPV